MKYLFVGYSKTGTKTIASAFKLLGFEVYDLEETMLFHAHQWIEIMDPKTSESEKRRIIYAMYKNIDVVTDHPANYSAFKNLCPTTSIWSFLTIFRIIFGQKNEIFKIAFPARPSGSFYWAILKI